MVVARLVVVGLLAVAGAGCINSTSLITIKPDGSGTIEQTMLFNVAAVKGLLAGMGGGELKESGGLLDEFDFKRTAERMGVRPVSLTPVKEGGFEGAKAVYAFDDITKVRLDQDPQVPGAAGADGSKRVPITFGFDRSNGRSVLTITVDEQVTASATEQAQDAPKLDEVDPAMLQMIKTMFNGFHVLIDLEVDGTIVKTNADYVNGSRVTLLELEAEGLFQDEKQLTALQSKVRPGASLSELRPYLKEIKGVKINHPSVTIEYR